MCIKYELYNNDIINNFTKWSFGITCWEVFSAGRIPYSGVDAMNMLKILEKGTRLEMPDNIACAPE